MNEMLAKIFSPLKETTVSRNGQALDLLESIATPSKKRATPRRASARKSVSFDMTPMSQAKHTPPKPDRTPLVHDAKHTGKSRKRRAPPLEDSADVADEGSSSSSSSSSATPSKDADDDKTRQNKAAPDSNDDDDDNTGGGGGGGEFAFKRFLGHRWEGDSIRIKVEWEDGERTWEPETALHHDAPQTLLDYWRRQPGGRGRPDNPRRPGFYEIHAIRKHTRDRRRLFVEWVGYGPHDATWEPRAVVEDAAPEILSDYWDSLPRPKRRRTAR